MNSLVVTTRLVRERTCIPVPEIHGWSSDEDNEAGCPYMFMDFVEGVSLGDVLQDLSPEKISQIVYEWAMYTWELTRLTFPSIGCLGTPTSTSSTDYPIVQKYLSAGSVDSGRDLLSPFYRGPYTSVSDYLFGISTLKKSAPHDDLAYDRFSFGTYLESLIPYALKPEWQRGPFVLCHDDFNVQNILVDPEQGHILAIIDWDYACVKPLQSVLSYPESLRWDLLAAHNPTFEPYQLQFAAQYRGVYADALVLASRNVVTGCHVNVMPFLDDSPFYAALERGLGESWREAEGMKVCCGVVFGEGSGEVLKLGGKAMRTGPWMSTYGARAGYLLPDDLYDPVPPPLPPAVKRLSILGKVGVKVGLNRVAKASVPAKMCGWRAWRERLLHRKRLQRVFGRLCQDEFRDEDNISLKRDGTVEKRKQMRWWSLFGKRIYGVRD